MKTALLLLTALLAPQNPQDASTRPTLTLKRLDGEVVTGTLVGVDKGKVKLHISVLGGSMTVTNNLADFDAASVFRIELAANPPKDFDGHFAMAKKAAEVGLRQQAGSEARAAIASVKGTPDYDKKNGEVRGWAANALEKMVRDAVAADNLEEARNSLKLLTTRLPDQRTEEQLDAIAGSVEALELKRHQDKTDKRQKRLDQKQRESIDRQLKPIEQAVEKGNKDWQQAVRKSGSTVASTNLCESAIKNYKKGYEALQGLVEKNPDDEPLAAAAASLGKEIHDNGIAAALHAANMLCIQSDYKKALDWTVRILAFDPGNAEAKAMQNTIQVAAAEASDVWGWGWRTSDDRPRGGGDRNQ